MKEENNNYCVYKHTLPDGRCYIGATNAGKGRWGYNGCNYRRHPLFYSLICQVGWSNIKHEILNEYLTKEEAQKLEKQLIIEAKAQNVSLNRLSGGYCMKERGHRSNETKRKIGKKNSHSHNQEAIAHFRNSNRWKFKPVRVYKDGNVIGEFENINCAAKSLNIPKQNIYQCLKRKKTCTTHGYTFEEMAQCAQRIGESPQMKYYKPTSNVRSGKDSARAKRVAQYAKDGTLIMEWDCISDAVRMLGVSGPGISECIKGTHKTAGGYIWKTVD